jgi:hypothetical protein
MAYTPGMIAAAAVAANLAKSSWIRRMFEEGARLKQEGGADKVFDFTLGNPEIELCRGLLGWPACESGGYVTGTEATSGVTAAGGR